MRAHSSTRLGEVEAARHQHQLLRVDLATASQVVSHGPLAVGPEQVPAAGAPDLLGHPVARPRTAGRATRDRRPGAAGARLAPRLRPAARRADSRSRSALDQVDRLVLGLGHRADRRDRVEDALDRGRLEGDDRDVGVDRAGDLVDLAVADRADAAQLLGQDQVGLGRRECLLVERVQRGAAVDRRGDQPVDVAADGGSARSWTLRVMTGLPTTSGG